MNIAAYYRDRRPRSGLTRAEASILGIPYPLKAGWLTAFGTKELTRDQEQQLAQFHTSKQLPLFGASSDE